MKPITGTNGAARETRATIMVIPGRAGADDVILVVTGAYRGGTVLTLGQAVSIAEANEMADYWNRQTTQVRP